MRTALITVNLLVATASAALFAYTFFARDHLMSLAEEYVVGKTVQHATPAVGHIETALKSPLVRAVPPDVRDAVQAEVASFRRDSDAYVRALVAKGGAVEKPKHALAEQVVKWKEGIRGYFDKTLLSLIRDVRIFAGTNFVAGLLAAWMASRARGRWRWHVLGLSVLLLVSISLHGYMFIDGLTFFRIVADMRAGWSYPVFVALTFLYLYLRFGKHVPLAPPTPAPASRTV